MITREELLHQWHSRKNSITVDTVTLSEQEVYFTASVLNELKDTKIDALTTRQVLERCRSGYRSHVPVGVCVSSILIMQKTFSNLR